MKIKYIGNFNDGTGWAKAATYTALALDAAGYDIYCEIVSYNSKVPSDKPLEPRIQELLDKKTEEVDTIVYHMLPSDYRYNTGVKNIGCLELETLNLSNALWIKKINMMDEIWVPNQASKNCLVNSGISEDKIKILHHSFNFDRVASAEEKNTIAGLNGTFNFAFVGEFLSRKNLEALLIAFHNEFDNTEPVSLLIKTNGNPENINQFCESIKGKMKKSNKYKKEVIVCNQLEEKDLFSLLKQCHALVVPSRGESWCYPALESMALGLPVVYTSGIGIDEYDVSGLSVASHATPCFGANDTLQDLYTSEDNWLEINILDLQKKMREIFTLYREERDLYNQKSSQCIEMASKFNFTNNELVRSAL
jgi:glycosyltransferase involved in cell wall biosynthesis